MDDVFIQGGKGFGWLTAQHVAALLQLPLLLMAILVQGKRCALPR
jgi:hypothetical protein